MLTLHNHTTYSCSS